MTLLIDNDFYTPWPILGVHLSKQWNLIRANTRTLAPIGRAVIIESDDGVTGKGALAGYEFGEQTFPNKFRIVWSTTGEEFRFQCNTGTTAVPVWETAFFVDADSTTEKTVFLDHVRFDKDITLVGDFYGFGSPTGFLDQIIAKDGLRTFTSATGTLSFNEDNFYLDKDSLGNPKLNSLASSDANTDTVTAKDGTRTFTSADASFSVAHTHFYLSKDSEDDPVLNFRPRLDASISGHFVDVPDKRIVLDRDAPMDYEIEYLTGHLERGFARATLEINDVPVTGIEKQHFFGTKETKYAALGANMVSGGDKVAIDFYPFYIETRDFSFTMGAVQTV